jgi:hypothetical protein
VGDADGNTITKYHLWDNTGNGEWVIAGAAQPADQTIQVTPAQLAQTTYQAAAGGTDLLEVQAYDGTAWSAWTPFDVTGSQPPVVTAANQTVASNAPVAASLLFSVSDADAQTPVKYHLWDNTGNGEWLVNGVAQPADQTIEVTAAQLAQTTYQAAAGGIDLLEVQAYDGFDWSTWTPFEVTGLPDLTSIVTAVNQTIASGASVAASSLILFSDPNGNAATKYHLWDSTGGGEWVVAGVAQPANQTIEVTAAQLAQTTYQAGAGTNDLLQAQAYDGSAWSPWTQFHVLAI